MYAMFTQVNAISFRARGTDCGFLQSLQGGVLNRVTLKIISVYFFHPLQVVFKQYNRCR